MSYPTGGSGYSGPTPAPSAGTGFGQPAASGSGSEAISESSGKGLPFYLTVGVAALGVINLLLGFAPYATVEGINIGGGRGTPDLDHSFFETPGLAALLAILLLAGALAGLSLLPQQNWIGAAAAASVAGFVGLLFQSFSLGDGVSLGWGAWVVLFLALVQAIAAVVTVLFESGIVSVPAPKAAAVSPSGYGTQATPAAPAGYTQPGYGAAPQAQQAQAQYAQGQQGQAAQQGQAQPSQAAYGQYAQQAYAQQPGQQSAYGQYGQSYGQQGYGQQPYGQPQQPYAQPGYGATPAGYGTPSGQQHRSPQPAGDDSATQHFGTPPGAQQPYAPTTGYGQSAAQPAQPASAGKPFGEEKPADPAADATRAFRPEDEQK